MTSAKPHLLTIPREIRNEIYSYLHQRIKFQDEILMQYAEGSTRDAHLCLENAPLINVLLTHSRLYDEYKESDCFRIPSAVLNVFYNDHIRDFLSYSMRNVLTTLARMQHITLLVPQAKDQASTMSRLFESLTRLGAAPCFVQFIFRYFRPHVDDVRDLQQSALSQVPHIPMELPKELGRLSLSCSGGGHRTGYGGYSGGRHYLRIDRLYVYCYTQGRSAATTCKFKYLLGVQNWLAYPTDMLEKLPENARRELVQLASSIQGWREWSA
jgi:hypothetical protein